MGRAGQGGALLFELKLAVLDPRQPPRLVPLALGEAYLRIGGRRCRRRCRRRSVGRREALRLLVSSDPSRDGQLAERRPALRPRPDSPDEGGRSPAEQGCGGGGAGECQAHEGECRACDSRSPLLLLGAGGVRTLRAVLGEQHRCGAIASRCALAQRQRRWASRCARQRRAFRGVSLPSRAFQLITAPFSSCRFLSAPYSSLQILTYHYIPF